VIVKIQRVLRKAMKEYRVQASVGEETLIAFISVDILREINTMDSASPLQSVKPLNKSKQI